MRILIALLTALFFHGTVGAQGLTRVMSGYAAISGPHAVLWVARDAGLFEKNGCARMWRTFVGVRPWRRL